MDNISLSDLSISITSGLTPLRSNNEFWLNGTIPWLKTEQLGKKYIYDTNEYISQKALDNTTIKLNPKNTISIAMYGEGKTRGSVSILKNEMTTNQACCNIYLNEEKAHFEYVYYYLKTQYDNLRNLSSGVRKNLNSNDIKNFKINIPKKINEQQKIASVLSSLDKKIELNNKINQELEAMAKTLYDYWFVQFDFPDENGKPYKSSGGKMVYNEKLRKVIPENWHSIKLNKIFKTDAGYPFDSTDFINDGKYKIITIKNVQFNNLNTVKVDYINQLPSKIAGTSILNIGDVLMSLTGNVGRVCFVNEDNLLLNQRVCKIYSENIDTSFIYILMQSEYIYKSAIKLATGSNQKNLSPVELLNIDIAYNIDIINNFIKIINPIYQQLINLQKENLELSNLRDWLLPMLMNGQVKIK